MKLNSNAMAKAVDIIITQGTDAAMNEYNRKVPCTENKQTGK